MPRTLQFRRYNAETLANTVGANGELIINTTNKTLTVHDGVLPGGYALLNSATDNNIDNYARTTANAAAAVNLTQNNSILNATNLAQAAYNRANTANGGGSITGNISISSTNSAINFVANSSGDGYGFSTIELRPDTNAYGDSYLVIDPTYPSHIHIRAGGVQDSSGAQLFLGGEKNYVRVTDGQGIRLQNEELDDNYYYYDENNQYVSGTWYEESGNYFIQFTTDDAQMVNHLSNFADGSPNEVLVYWNPGSGVVSQTMTCPTGFWQGIGNVYTAQVNSTLTANNLVLTAIEFHLFTTRTNSLRLENNDFTVDVTDDVRIYARDVFSLRNRSINDPIEIVTDYDANAWTWSFNTDKTLRVPGAVNFQQNSTIPLGPPVINGTNDRVRLWDFEGGGTGFNYAIGAEGNHVWFGMDVNNGTGGFKFYSRDNQVFKIRDDGALLFADGSIQTMAANTGNVTFNETTIQGVGNEYGGQGLYLSPDPALTANLMYFRIRGGDNPTHLHFDTGDGNIYDQYFGDDGKYLKLEAGNQGNVIIGVNGTGGPISWQFNNNGTLQLPVGGNILEESSPAGLGNTITLAPNGGYDANQKLRIYPTVGEGNHLHLTTGGDTTELYLGDDNHYVKLANNGNVDIGVGKSALVTDVSIDAADSFGPGVWRLFVLDSVYPTLGTIVKVGGNVTTSWGTPVVATITDIYHDIGYGRWVFSVDQDITGGFSSGALATFGPGYRTWSFSTNYFGSPDESVLVAPQGDAQHVGAIAFPGSLGFPLQGGLLGWVGNISSPFDNTVCLQSTSNVSITAQSSLWQFNYDGSVTFPYSTLKAPDENEFNITTTFDNDSSYAEFNPAGPFSTFGSYKASENKNIFVETRWMPANTSYVAIGVADKIWTFNNNGTLTFPTGNVQTGAAISITELKALVANAATYADFKTAIAAL